MSETATSRHANLDQLIFREHFSRAGHERAEQIELALAERDRLAATNQTPVTGVELEGTERERVAARHGRIVMQRRDTGRHTAE